MPTDTTPSKNDPVQTRIGHTLAAMRQSASADLSAAMLVDLLAAHARHFTHANKELLGLIVTAQRHLERMIDDITADRWLTKTSALERVAAACEERDRATRALNEVAGRVLHLCAEGVLRPAPAVPAEDATGS